MSINDTPEIREIYKNFTIEEVTTTYSCASAGNKVRATELLIMNYPPKNTPKSGV
ncbi:MAG: hypothetical protein NTU69_03285 [Proteobacteria bacterium]|nr:hypothetical protein [Pseudomonadota bacterium]